MPKNALIAASVVALTLAIVVGFLLYGRKTEETVIHRVGIVSGVDAFYPVIDGFKEEMVKLGYIEGVNVEYDVARFPFPDKALITAALKKFEADGVDLVFAYPTEPAIEAKAVLKDSGIPIIFSVGTIEDTDLVETAGSPGGDITGVRYPGPELALTRFELLREMKPDMKRLWLAYSATYPAVKSALRVLRPAAEKAGITLVENPLADLADLEKAAVERGASGKADVDAALVMPENIVQSPSGWAVMSAFGAKYKVPIGGSASFEADDGAVFSHIPSNHDFGRLAAPLAQKIFNGIPAGSIPVVTPESRLRLNYTLAQELGLVVSESLLGRASEIIR